MIANQQHIYITETCGRTTVISNDKHWKLVAENDLGESVVAPPAISNGDILIRGEQHLFLIRSMDQRVE